ncbi:MAG: amino acid adenylation domain-containing protein [Cyanobacteria bacterium P01_H01_bin.35]
MTNTTLAGFRLSPQQKYLWKLQGNNINYLAKCTIKIQGKVKVNILKSALEKILNRHESFRTTFQRRPGIKMPIQVILDNGNFYWNHLNLNHLKSEKQTEKIGEILGNQNGLMTQVDQQPIFPTAFVTLSEEEHILLVSLPALIADSFTLNNLVKEISESYDLCLKELDFDEEAVQYLQFSEWQNELLEEEEAEAEIAYWQDQQFQSVNLPFEKSQFEAAKFTPEQYSLDLDPNVIAKLEANTPPNITIDNFLLGCWQVLLWRLTKQSDITVKTVFSGRQYEDLEEVMGLLAKSLPISCQLEENLKFTQLLEEISDRFTEAGEKQEYFINSESEPPAIGFEFIDISKIYSGGDLSFSLENLSVIFDNFKVKLNCIKTQESITAEFQYNSELINIDVIKSFAKQFETLVTSAVETLNTEKLDEISLSQLNIFSESESKRLLDELNQTEQNYPQDKLIHQIFESQAEQTPNNIAVVFEEQKVTYAELNSQANQLAHYLQKIGVETETIVGVFMERSVEVIIAILAILKAGAAYLPLDTKLPEENLAFRLEDAGVNILLSHSEIAPKNLDQNIKIITRTDENIAQQPQTNSTSKVSTENLAYILYTSGSTGKPKGVAIEHRQILNYLHGIQEKLQISSSATSAIVSTFAADLGNTVIFPTLCSGGCLHIISQECASDATVLADYFQRHPIDYLKIVPSHLSALLTSNPSPYLLPRQYLILGGEAATWDLIANIQQHSPQCSILNHYGPTETTVGVLTYTANNQNNYNTKTVPIGRPLANSQVYILDEKLQPVPVGVSGELYIGGAGLARGYFNRPELTAEKFIPLPSPLERGVRGDRSSLYKTGDLVRYLPDGNIEFLGRIDNQVKIRGFRIELGEIEAAIASHPEIQTAVVIVRENNSGNKRLIAYFVPTKKQFSPNNLRQFLQDKLADYAIPSNFVKLEFLPLTPNGKIDRKALPDPDNIRPELENNFVAPRNQTEELLANIWSELLGVAKVGIHDNFFELGGHSLAAVQLVSKISTSFNISLPVKTLLLNPTVDKLSNSIAELLQEKNVSQQPSSQSINNEVQETLNEKVVQTKNSEYVQFESRSLLSLFSVGKIPPVDAVALGYLKESDAEMFGFSRDYVIENLCENLPVLRIVRQTNWGRIAGITLPRFGSDLYSNQDDAVQVIIEALEMAAGIGAKFVSLTGLIPSATDYGCAITKAIANRQDLPKITTGHRTTGSAVVLGIKKICEQSGRHLSREKVGFIGLGSVGMNVLPLMLKCLPHPQEITLCDVFSKSEFLENIQQQLVEKFGFQGKINLALSKTTVPEKIYDATLIVGATNVADVLDIMQVNPGTLIVDDSAPHCFSVEQAVQRFQEQEDILFTEGGVLQAPFPTKITIYLPPSLEKFINNAQKEATLNLNPFNIMGCVFSSLLSFQFEKLEPTVGVCDGEKSELHYQVLQELGFQASELHCGEYVLPTTSIANFRHRFGKDLAKQ